MKYILASQDNDMKILCTRDIVRLTKPDSWLQLKAIKAFAGAVDNRSALGLSENGLSGIDVSSDINILLDLTEDVIAGGKSGHFLAKEIKEKMHFLDQDDSRIKKYSHMVFALAKPKSNLQMWAAKKTVKRRKSRRPLVSLNWMCGFLPAPSL